MSVTLPLRSDLDAYEVRVTLDKVDYDLRFVWNERDEQHYLSIFATDSPTLSDGSRVAILPSIPVLIGTPLLRNLPGVPGTDRPAGELVALDTSNQNEEAGQRDLGARVVLVYTPEAELPEGYRE